MPERVSRSTPGPVDVSVVITTRDRASLLAATLGSLESQDWDALRWELIVVDNGSSDATRERLEAFSETLPVRYHYLERPGKTRAQNLALDHVRGELVVFTDDDVRFDRHWLINLWQASQRWSHASVLGGAIELQLLEELPKWLATSEGEKILKRHCAHYAPRADEGYTTVAPLGPNMAVRRRALAGVRFNEEMGPDGTSNYIKSGDTYLTQLIMARGGGCVYVPDARVFHRVRAEQLHLKSLFAGGFRRGRKNAYIYAKPARRLIAGAPLKLWLRQVKSWFRYTLAFGAGTRKRYETGLKYHYRRGYLHQVRLNNRRQGG
jgi:glycosyltransferase involved in cell wall biosynthesis